ncbi:hypothetical protein P171DRAFT_42147 [Karstenula rhodostoma CBS 690.94]|uniref:Uncharacterized protein n=1 Tax=Karstenula rhodostoma CBS 690.94 TaxID=1392251 RepID=A0A9P4PIN9_9PLEO|nr:hypothetical protein P171DRAFT_42147 [Karstenula rhodostoma CBS 690.94]
MLFHHILTPLLFTTTSLATSTRTRKPWGADILSSLYSPPSTSISTPPTSPPPPIAHPTPTTPLANRKYTRTLTSSRTVATPTTPAPPLPPARTPAPPPIDYGKIEQPRADAPEVVEKREESMSRVQQVSASVVSTAQPGTTILVYNEMRHGPAFWKTGAESRAVYVVLGLHGALYGRTRRSWCRCRVCGV